MAEQGPLILDVDGTFLKTDLLLENFWAGLGRSPARVVSACARHWRAPAQLKAELVQIAPLRTDLMPINPEIAALAQLAMAEGREVCLASGSDRHLVARLAAEYGFSDRVFASNGANNMVGQSKSRELVRTFGADGYDYAGNEARDMAVWNHARVAIVVGDVPQTASLSQRGKPVIQIPGGWTFSALWSALRPHQWVKNILLFLAMIAAHQFDLATLGQVLLGIAAFCAAASSIYIVNDLLDLEADRLHPTKRSRPFASGAVPIPVGMITCFALALLAMLAAGCIGWAFFGLVLLYMATSLAYSLRLKRMRWVDIATLAALYTSRVIAGAIAGDVNASIYMLTFAYPIFIALACVKRLTELRHATGTNRLPGRGYGLADRDDLLNVAWLGVAGALLMFLLYSFSEQGRMLYPDTWLLWVAMVPMAWWLVRMVTLGWLGRQDDDPIVFALKDKLGLGLLMIVLSVMFWAAGLWARWFGG